MKKNGFASLIGIWILGLSTLSAQGYDPDWVCCPLACDPCCSPCGPSESQFFIGAEWLYWEASQSGLQIGFVTNAPLSTSGGNSQTGIVGPTGGTGPRVDFAQIADPSAEPITDIKGHAIRPEKQWTSGFRVCAGYYVPCSNWEIGLSFAYLPSQNNNLRHSVIDNDDSSSSSNSSENGTSNSEFITLLNGFPLIGNGAASFTNITGQWKLKFAYGDLDFAREIYLCSNLNIKPHIGARGLWIEEKYHFDATGASTSQEFGRSEISFDNFFKERINGYGIEGGLWVDWNIGCDFSIIGHFGGAILYSHYSVNSAIIESETTSGVLNPTPVVVGEIHLKDKFWSANPMLDTFLGFEYASHFCDTAVFIRAGWEQHVIFDTNQWSRDAGNLCLQGLTLGAGVAF